MNKNTDDFEAGIQYGFRISQKMPELVALVGAGMPLVRNEFDQGVLVAMYQYKKMRQRERLALIRSGKKHTHEHER